MASIDKPQPHASLKYISLVTLTVQNASLILWMRWVTTRDVDMFLAGTAVIMAELTKCIAALIIILVQEGDVSAWLNHLYQNLVMNPMDSVYVSVPSLVYVLQNNLQYLAVANLDAATYQVSYQLKILTTALFSVAMLGRKLSFQQWISLVILMAGVASVQMQPSSGEAKDTSHQNLLVGMTAVIVSCMMSGFAGVYFEKILKGSPQSVWLRNVQLGFLGTIIGLITLFIKDREKVMANGFFYGYDWAVVVAIMLQSLGGLIVAVVVKYADNILKGFATSGAIIISCIFSIYFFDFTLSIQFIIGASLVIASVYMYGRYPYVAPKPITAA